MPAELEVYTELNNWQGMMARREQLKLLFPEGLLQEIPAVTGKVTKQREEGVHVPQISHDPLGRASLGPAGFAPFL